MCNIESFGDCCSEIVGTKIWKPCAAMCCTLTVIPWVFVFYSFAFGDSDPENCWITEGELFVS